jgi:hypothetical protein
MKKIAFIIIMVFGIGTQMLAQNINTDFVALDYYCPDYEQLQAQYAGQSNAYIVTASEIKAPQQIATALTGKNVTDLHIFVNTKPGAMVFTCISLTPGNIDEYAVPLATWASHVSGKVIVHSTEVFSAEYGQLFQTKLQQLTGLQFIMQ